MNFQANSNSLQRVRNTVSSEDSSDNFYLRKRIYYNDSALKKGGGGTGLLYGASDQSSSSSKKKKKQSASSNSSGIHNFNPCGQSANSSSEKSDQRHFDRLIRRNEILDFYELQNEHPDTASNILSQRNEGSVLKMNEQMSEIEEADIEADDTNFSPSKNLSKEEGSSKTLKPIISHSEEKVLANNYYNNSLEKQVERLVTSESKVGTKLLLDAKENKLAFLTPDKAPYEYVTTSAELKEFVISESSHKSGSPNITPQKYLETITEQATDMEMDNTNYAK